MADLRPDAQLGLEGFSAPSTRFTNREEWRDGLRAELLRRYREGPPRDVTTDDVWHIIDTHPDFKRPAGVHPNALGTFFSAWKRATPVMVQLADGGQIHGEVVSTREGANGNALRRWRI